MDKGTHIGDTVRIRRPPKVTTDELGHSVWMCGVEPLEAALELEPLPGFDPYDTAAGSRWSERINLLMDF